MSLTQEERDLIDPQGATDRKVASEAVAIQEELTDLNPNTEMDTKEFGEHVRNGGWRLGLLVARNVEEEYGAGEKPWENEGISRATWYRQQSEKTGENSPVVSKISARAFAKQAGNIDKNTVVKYLKAWNMASTDNYIPKSSSLSPGQEVDFSQTDDDGHLILTPKLWDFYFKPKGDDNDPTVYDFFKGLSKYDEESVREWIQVDNFKGQSSFRPKEVYDFLESINRVSKLAMELYLSIEDDLGMEDTE